MKELLYTGEIVLVKDYKNKIIPYYTKQYNHDLYQYDEREKLIVELVSVIDNMINKNSNNIFILENNESVINKFVDLEYLNSNIVSKEFINSNCGGFLISNDRKIYKFKYLLHSLLDFRKISYSNNSKNAIELSKKYDIIYINISNGEIFTAYNGIVTEKETLVDIKNFLLKNYQPPTQEIKQDYDVESLKNYELEKLFKKFYKQKNMEMYFKIKKEYNKRMREKKEEINEYKKQKRKIKLEVE